MKNGFLGDVNRFLDYHLTPAVKTILVINVLFTIGLTLLGSIFPRQVIRDPMTHFIIGVQPGSTDIIVRLLAESAHDSLRRGFVWQFLTYMFVHESVWHLLFNMLALWFFGPELENQWGTRAFWKFYLTVGIGAGLLHALFTVASAPYQSIIGASGAIYGVLLAYAAYWPNRIVLLYGIVPLKIKTLVIIAIVAEFWMSSSGVNTEVSHLTHLTGLAVAYVYLAIRHKDWNIRNWRWKAL